MSGAVVRTTPAKLRNLLQRRAKASEKAVRRAALSSAHRGKTMITGHTPGDLGQLRLSWDVKKPLAMGRELAELVNDAPHAGSVEMGARPHPVSSEGIAALHAWVWRHRNYFDIGTKGRDAKKEALGIAYAIAKKIRVKGQKPTYFVRDKLPTFFRITAAEINREFAKLAAKGKL